MSWVNVPVSSQRWRKTSLLFPRNFWHCWFWMLVFFFSLLLSPTRPSLSQQVPDHERAFILVQGGDASPKRAAARCHPCPHPASHCFKDQGFSVKLNVGVQKRGWCRRRSYPLCVQGWSHHRKMEDAVMPFLVSKGVNLFVFAELLNGKALFARGLINSSTHKNA